MKLLIHPVTERHLTAFQAAPSHAVRLIGPKGSGKLSLAKQLASSVLNVTNLTAYPYQRHISTETGGSIGIETIRELEKFMTLKVSGDKPHNRVIIIEQAELMTIEAQNALLKTLEEPPPGTILILTVNQEQALLPTVRSRTQTISINRPDKTTLTAHFMSKGSPAPAIEQAYAISGGLPGLMQALLSEEDHPLQAATERARQLLSQTAYQRLLVVDELAKQKDLARDTLFILQQMAHVKLQTAQGAAAKKWQNILQASYQAAEDLSHNAQAKLALSNLMLHL